MCSKTRSIILTLCAFTSVMLMATGCPKPDSASAEALKRTLTESVLIEDRSQASYITASPNLRRIAYTTGTDDKEFVVIDGVEGSQYDIVSWIPIFSPDSQRVAYEAKIGGDWCVVVDGQEGNKYRSVDFLTFSQDSSQFAYTAYDGDGYFVVLNGMEEKQHVEVAYPTFSPDSQHFAYLAWDGDWCFVVLDGDEERKYDGVYPPVFSPDSQHFAYAAIDHNELFMVVDGQEERHYWSECTTEIFYPTFSPDSNRLAYFTFVNEPNLSWVVVVDEQKDKEYEISYWDYSTLLGLDLIFSPDGERLAYSGKINLPGVGQRWFVVVDEQEGNYYDSVWGLTFSPDSQHLAYIAYEEDGAFIVMDEVEGKRYDDVSFPAFSPDSKHLAYVATLEDKQFVVVDGVEGKQYEGVINYRYGEGFPIGEIIHVVFDSADSLHYLVRQGNTIYLVEEKIRSVRGDNVIEVHKSNGTSRILEPADLSFDSLTVTPNEVTPGMEVTVTVDVVNSGELVGDCDVTLSLNDTEIETKTVVVAGGGTRRINFIVTEDEPGEYVVAIGTLTDILVVFEPVELTAVTFNDRNLEAVIRNIIKKPEGIIYSSDLESITTLTATKKGISSLGGLEYCVNLKTLDLGENEIVLIESLAGLTNLTQLNLRENNIRNISPLSGLNNLTQLTLSDNNISDISPLVNLTNITGLGLDDNSIGDITALASLINLRGLSMVASNVSDISPLRNLTNLESVSFVNNNITDISPLAELRNLTNLGLAQNNIVDISPLAGLTKLLVLNLWTNNISNISPLIGLSDLETLFLADNNIGNISPLQNLTKLRWLVLHDNQISDITPLVSNPGLASGDRITLINNPLSDNAVSVHIPQLEARGVTIESDSELPEPEIVSPPTIDGTISEGEWDMSLEIDFTVTTTSVGTIPGTTYFIHDGENLYMAVRFSCGTISTGDFLTVHFDNDGTGGARVIGDDVIQISSSYFDSYVSAVGATPQVGVTLREDTIDGGQANGTGIRSTDGTYTTYEFWHPLDSNDNLHDFSLQSEDTFGFMIVLKIGMGQLCTFPIASTTTTESYVRILIKPSTLELVD